MRALLTLRITNIRVERLHEISEADAKAEGVSFGNITDPATGEIDRDAGVVTDEDANAALRKFDQWLTAEVA